MKQSVLIDTNVMMVALSPRSNLHWIYQSLIHEEFNLIISNEILLEYEEQIIRRYDESVVADFLLILAEANNVVHHEPYFKWNLIIADVDDNKFSDCAVSSAADYLITHDKHFDILKTISFPVVQVIDAFQFKEILERK